MKEKAMKLGNYWSYRMKKIFVKGPFLTQSGYGHHARTVLRALKTREDLFDIYLQPINWGKTSWIWEDSEERQWIDRLLQKTIAYTTQNNGQPEFDISVQVTIPNEWEKLAPINIGVTAGIESTRISPQWIGKTFDMDKILTISKHSADGIVNTVYQATNNQNGQTFNYKCERPVETIHFPVRSVEAKKIDLKLSTKFNFLTVSQIGPRKNLEQLIKCFVEQFGDNKDVGLIVKTNMAKNSLIDRANTEAKFKQFLSNFPDRKCKIYLLHGYLTDEEMVGLYTHSKVKAIVTTTHGEGFCLPLFEAAQNALPVIATDWSGHLDFLYMPQKQKNGSNKLKHMFGKISYTLGPIGEDAVWEGVLIKDSMWAYPEEGSIKMNLEDVYKDHGRFKKRAKILQKWILESFSEKKINKQYVESLFGEPVIDVEVEDLPKISLITSVFKADDYIEQLMEDVTRQTIFKEKCEWIILNANESGHDFEEEVILKYVEKYPDNIIYKRLEEDPGIFDTWNMGIKMSTGDYITNVNCDDRRAPAGLEKQAKLLFVNDDVDLVYNDSYIVHDPNIMWEDVKPDCQKYNFEKFSKEAMLRGNLPHNNPMWRKSVHDTYGYFNQYYKSAADWDFWLRCAFGGSKFKKHSEVLGVYYFNPTGMSTNPEHDSWKQEHEREIFQNYLNILQDMQKQNAA